MFVWKFCNNAGYWFLHFTWSVWKPMYVAILKKTLLMNSVLHSYGIFLTCVSNISDFWEDVCLHSANSALGISWHFIHFGFTCKKVELVLWAFTHFTSSGFGYSTAVMVILGPLLNFIVIFFFLGVVNYITRDPFDYITWSLV